MYEMAHIFYHSNKIYVTSYFFRMFFIYATYSKIDIN